MSMGRYGPTRNSDSGIYKSFFDNHPDAVYVLDLNGHFIDANPVCVDVFGYALEEFLGMSFQQIIVPEQLGEWLSSGVTNWDSGEPCTFETAIQHKNGTLVELHITEIPMVVSDAVVGIIGIAKDITQQKQVEAEFREIQRLFQLITENSQDIISYSVADRTFGYVSPSIRSLLGYDPDEVIGQPNSYLYHPEDVPYVEEIGRRIADGEDVPRFTCRVRCKSGNYLWYETTLKIVRNEQGEVLQVVGVGRDVSELMSLQESLEHAAAMTGLGHWEWDIQTGHIFHSEQAYRNLGTHRDVGPRTLSEFKAFMHPEDIARWENDIQKAIETGSLFEGVYRIVRQDGGVRYLHSRGEVVFGEGGTPVRMMGAAQDVTESQLLQLQLQQSQEQYRRLVDNSRDAIGILEHGQCTYLNDTGLKMFRAADATQIIGKHYDEFLPSNYLDGPNQDDRLDNIEQSTESIELKLERLDGSLFDAEISGIPFAENSVQVVIRDVTERKRTDELLLRSEKLSAVGQLAAGIAHEIRNPLTTLKGFIQILGEKTNGAEQRYFDVMKSELNRIEMILSEMLVLAKPQVTRFIQHNVEVLLDEVITLLSAQALLANVVIESGFHSTSSLVLCEENQLKQVFINLIKNGIEAMPEGGTLCVHTKSENGNLCIEFIDEGEGIPADRIPKLGEPFFTTKESGTGLGLMVSQKIISTHQGDIRISSVLGEGTTVCLTLPLNLSDVSAKGGFA